VLSKLLTACLFLTALFMIVGFVLLGVNSDKIMKVATVVFLVSLAVVICLGLILALLEKE
jgi:hypothetical protein